MRKNMYLGTSFATFLVVIMAAATAEASEQDLVSVSSNNADSNIIDNAVSSSLKQTSGADHSKDAPQPIVHPSLATSSEHRETHIDAFPETNPESTDIPDDPSIFSPADNDLYADGEMYPAQDELQNIPEAGSADYIILNLPEEDKRFMRGLKRDQGSSEINEDKRFMRGLTFKRDQGSSEINEDKRFMRGLTFKRDQGSSEINEDKRFMRGLTFKRDFNDADTDLDDLSLEEKRFMRGFNKYAKKDDKRFMRGLRDSDYLDNIEADKRFMRGLRSGEYDNVEDKRFIVGLHRLGRFDKRFMRGFGNYNKRFMHGLQNYGKRFMRGLIKRDQTAAVENEKRFIVGLSGYGRRASTLTDDTLESGTDDMSKRFIKGLLPYTKSNHGKRFMKGFRLYSKKYSPVSVEHSKPGNELSSDKRFMRGLTKKHSNDVAGRYNQPSGQGSLLGSDTDSSQLDKRFMRGLIKKSDDGPEDVDKRFMRGLGKKSAGGAEEMDKRFMRGLGKKSDNGVEDMDKRFIKGLIKKSDDSVEDVDKRFIKGLIKKSDGGIEDVNKRFIKGLVRKSEEDKRFMRGLHKKFDGNAQNLFIKGFLGNENTLDRSSDSFDNTNEINEDDVDKRFMRGFGKKNMLEKELQPVYDKRFMRGLYAKKERQGKDKRFMRGFHKFAKKDNELTDDEMNNEDGSNVLEGSRFDSEHKRFMKGLTNKGGKRFIKGLRNYAKKNDDEVEVDADKRFMRGLVKKEDALDDSQDEKRFIKGLVKKASYGEKEAGTSVNEGSRTSAKNDSQLDKRFMRGLGKRESGSIREKRETGFRDDNDVDLLRRLTEKGNYEKGDSLFETGDNSIWNDLPDYGSEFTHNKRFMRGLGRYAKRDSDLDESSNNFNNIDNEFDENQEITKRFIKGFFGHYNNGKRLHYALAKPDEFDSVSGADKRFIKGLDMYTRPLGKRFMRGLQQYGKRGYDDTFLEDKRFMRGLNRYVGKRFMRGLGRFAKRPTDGDSLYSNELYHTRFPTDYLNLFPQQQLLSPSYRHSQLISSLHGDQNRQLGL
ncbi:hypothetical protein BsWGS_26983 [Bradybaena similaris]